MGSIEIDGKAASAERARQLLARMTVEEKIGQMCQIDGRKDPDTWILERHAGSILHVTGEETVRLQKLAEKSRLSIPVLFGIDAIHGHAFQEGSTVFPSQLALSSSWNPDLLEAVARVTAREVASTGIHWTFSPVLCLGRDPRWGRMDETFGEDPFLAGKLGAAMVRGYQGADLADPESILACAKHFAAHGETVGGRDSTEGELTRRKLLTVFLPPFEEAVRAGCATIMTAYHAMDGVPCSANPWLLRSVLKETWGFDGIVVTDWDNIGRMITQQHTSADFADASRVGIEAGNDMIMVTPDFFQAALSLVKSGRVREALIDEAVLRILTLKFRLGLFDGKRYSSVPSRDVLLRTDHREKAFESAKETIVLLKNGVLKNGKPLLPLSGVKQLAVVGPNADNVLAQLGDWSFGPGDWDTKRSNGLHRDSTVTVLQGIRARAAREESQGRGCKVLYMPGCTVNGEGDKDLEASGRGIEAAAMAAWNSEVTIAVVGDDIDLNGEAHDRANLDLTGRQQELLEAVKKTGTPLVVVLVCGKPLTVPWIAEHADAVVLAFNPGLEGGSALASVLFGDTNPSGKLSISWPRATGQLPVYYNQLPGWHAPSYIDLPAEPVYHFGYGLSYTAWSCSDLRVERTKQGPDSADTLEVSVRLRNTGHRTGTEIVQVYVNDRVSSVTTPVRELKGFTRVELEAGESRVVTVKVPVSTLSLVNAAGERVVEPGEFEIMAGSSSRDGDLLSTVITL